MCQFNFVPVPDKPFCFMAVDKVTGKSVNIGKALTDRVQKRMDDYVASR